MIWLLDPDVQCSAKSATKFFSRSRKARILNFLKGGLSDHFNDRFGSCFESINPVARTIQIHLVDLENQFSSRDTVSTN